MLYNLILILILPYLLPVYLVTSIIKPRYRVGLFERLGFWKRRDSAWSLNDTRPLLFWIHMASVGEIQAGWPLIEALVRRYPTCRFVFTTLTVSGRTLLIERSPELGFPANEVTVRLFPLDLPFLAGIKLRKFRPDLVILLETELWPNFLGAAQRLGIPVVVVNGRISQRSYPRYRMFRWFFKPCLRGINRFLMQTPEDAERITHIGAPGYRVSVVGNLKYEQRVKSLTQKQVMELRQAWKWSSADLVWVAGSTHAGEEDQIISVFRSLKNDYPDFRLILAPRHPDRLAEIKALLEDQQIQYRLFSKRAVHSGSRADVILVDTVGNLQQLYALADVVFVGGTLVPVGGHNLAEPALYGKPVLFGPNVQEVQATARVLVERGGGISVQEGASLREQIRYLLSNPARRFEMGDRARKAIQEQQGMVDQTVARMASILNAHPVESNHPLNQRGPCLKWMEARLWGTGNNTGTTGLDGIFRGLSLIYQGFMSLRNNSYRFGILRSGRLSRPVISVGNITMGGTGKTPAVVAICQLLRKNGRRPVVLSRGYGGENRAPVLEVSDGEQAKWPPHIVGDEPVLMARKLPGVPIIIGPDRFKVGQAAIAAYHPDVLILDDGFQHRRLEREMDLVLLDESEPFGNGYLLPAGPLREPINQLRRATAILLTRVESKRNAEELEVYLRRVCGERPIFKSRHQLTACFSLAEGESSRRIDLESLHGKRVFIVSGIARPWGFVRSLKQAGLEVAGTGFFPDHFAFRLEDIKRMNREARNLGASVILTTEKDAVRLESQPSSLQNWWAVEMELLLMDTKSWEDQILQVV